MFILMRISQSLSLSLSHLETTGSLSRLFSAGGVVLGRYLSSRNTASLPRSLSSSVVVTSVVASSSSSSSSDSSSVVWTLLLTLVFISSRV